MKLALVVELDAMTPEDFDRAVSELSERLLRASQQVRRLRSASLQIRAE